MFSIEELNNKWIAYKKQTNYDPQVVVLGKQERMELDSIVCTSNIRNYENWGKNCLEERAILGLDIEFSDKESEFYVKEYKREWS